MQVNLKQSLEQIENNYWGEATYDSHLVITCHQLRKKPLIDFSTEDLRILIGQNISLNILVPLALERLKQNIMSEGDLYPGDLLQNVLNADRNYWAKNSALHRKLTKLYKNNFPSIEKRAGKSIGKGTFRMITKSFEKFSKATAN